MTNNKTKEMKKRKNKMPIFIPNQPTMKVWHYDLGESSPDHQAELRKQRENQKKLMLNNKNHKY